jgi:hypothetical protein
MVAIYRFRSPEWTVPRGRQCPRALQSMPKTGPNTTGIHSMAYQGGVLVGIGISYILGLYENDQVVVHGTFPARAVGDSEGATCAIDGDGVAGAGEDGAFGGRELLLL